MLSIRFILISFGFLSEPRNIFYYYYIKDLQKSHGEDLILMLILWKDFLQISGSYFNVFKCFFS